jgi:diaminopimelate decarboxylase
MDHFDYRDGRLWPRAWTWPHWPRSMAPRPTCIRAPPWNATGAPSTAPSGTHPHLVCFAVKANSNLAVLNLLARLGSGFDIVSGGELERVLRAGGDPGKVVFSGVGKPPAEMRRALEIGIRCFNVESACRSWSACNEVAGELGVRRRCPCASTPTWTPAPIPTSPPA